MQLFFFSLFLVVAGITIGLIYKYMPMERKIKRIANLGVVFIAGISKKKLYGSPDSPQELSFYRYFHRLPLALSLSAWRKSYQKTEKK